MFLVLNNLTAGHSCLKIKQEQFKVVSSIATNFLLIIKQFNSL